MIILGLDPSLSCTGWGVILSEGSRLTHVANGQVPTDTKAPMAERLHHLHDAVAALIAVHAPDRVGIEEVFANKNPQSTLKLAQARLRLDALSPEERTVLLEKARQLQAT